MPKAHDTNSSICGSRYLEILLIKEDTDSAWHHIEEFPASRNCHWQNCYGATNKIHVTAPREHYLLLDQASFHSRALQTITVRYSIDFWNLHHQHQHVPALSSTRTDWSRRQTSYWPKSNAKSCTYTSFSTIILAGRGKKQLQDDLALGVLEKFPIGKLFTWCHWMVLVKKLDDTP